MKIYYVINDYTMQPVEYFLREEDAEKFLALYGDDKNFRICSNEMYTSMEEYKDKNKDEYIKMLKYAIETYGNLLKGMKLDSNNDYLYMFSINFEGKKYVMYSHDLRKLLDGKYVPNSIRYYGEYGPESLFHSYGENFDEKKDKELEQKLAPRFVKEYNSQLEKYKNLLNKYKMEYLQLSKDKQNILVPNWEYNEKV